MENRKFLSLESFDKWASEKNIKIYHEHHDPITNNTFKRGEIVNLINGYGVVLNNFQIKGFDAEPSKDRPNAIVYVYDDCYWFPIEIDRLLKIK